MNSLALPVKYRHRSKGLTIQRIEVLKQLMAYEAEFSYPPSVRELALRLGRNSPSTVHSHLESLERQGMVQRLPRTARAWRATDRGRRLFSGHHLAA